MVGVIFAVLSAVGASTLGIFGKLAIHSGLPRDSALFYRFAFSSPILLLLSRITGEKKIKPKQIAQAMVLGFVTMSVTSTLFLIVVEKLGAGLNSVIFYSYPAFTALFSWIFLKEHIPTKKWFWVITTLASVSLLINPASSHFNLEGFALGFILAIWFSLYVLFAMQIVKTLPPLCSSGLVALGATLALLILAYARGNLCLPVKIQWLWVAGLALFSTVVHFGFMYLALARIGAMRTSFLATLEVVFTLILSVLFLQESFTARDLIGACGVVTSVLLLGFTSQPKS